MRKSVSRSIHLPIAAALVAVALAPAIAAAAPINTPFLSVDFDGTSGSGFGPTQSAFASFTVANPVNATTLTESVGGYNVTIAQNPAATGASLTSRDRGSNGGGTFDNLYRDFALVLRDSGHALGYSWLSISVAGLSPNTNYEFTGFSSDSFSVSGAASGAVRDGFSPNVPVEYQPGATPASGGPYYYTPIMTNPQGEYDDSVSFNATSDGTGTLTVYAFGDSNSFSSQTATIVNGFQVGLVASAPEPASLAVVSVGVVGLIARRRRA